MRSLTNGARNDLHQTVSGADPMRGRSDTKRPTKDEGP